MIRILYICTVPIGNNGITNVIFNYIENIDSTRFHIDILGINNPEKIYIDRLKATNGKFYCCTYREKNPIKYICYLNKIVRDYKIVHVHGNSGTMAIDLLGALLGGCKIRIAHSHNSNCVYKKVHYLLKPFVDLLSTERFACSEEAGRWVYKKKFKILINAFKLDKFVFTEEQRNSTRKNLGIKKNEILLGHVGLFNEQKNQDFLIKVLKSCLENNMSVKLCLVGKGEYEERIRKKCSELDIENKVIFYGETNNVQNVLSAMDIFLFPSLFEGLGIALIEAQIMGLPCIASEYVPRITNLNGITKYMSIDDDSIYDWVREIGCCREKIENRLWLIRRVNRSNYNIDFQIKRVQELYQKLVEIT